MSRFRETINTVVKVVAASAIVDGDLTTGTYNTFNDTVVVSTMYVAIALHLQLVLCL